MTKTPSRITAAPHSRYAAQVALTRIAIVVTGALALLLASARAVRAQEGHLAPAHVPIQDAAPATAAFSR